MKNLFKGVYKGKKALVTGHTGFKGSWLCVWLKELGANVIGYSLEPPSVPNNFEVCNLKSKITHVHGDIGDLKHLQEVFKDNNPEIVFHLAAQPLVRLAYDEPKLTFDTNVGGTINILEAARRTRSVRAFINVTSDKCYENKEWIYGYRENDPVGGYDPYSSSKGCAELITTSYRRSFFHPEDYGGKHNILLASARSGNVIGGGDWGVDRLVPDIVRAITDNKKLFVRNPEATRPWQHVLEPLAGYLLLGQNLLEGKTEFADAWNFGPDKESHIAVKALVEGIKTRWDRFDYVIDADSDNPHEAKLLKLDCSKAHTLLQWRPVWDFEKILDVTVRWYREHYENGKVRTLKDLELYVNDAGKNNIDWTNQFI